MTAHIDHMSVVVSDAGKSKAFYSAALAPLGMSVLMDFGDAFGMGEDAPFLWLGTGEPHHMHFAIGAANRAAVDAFHAAALAAGGRDNGAPGLRTDYSPTYYAAFVLDPDGHNVEAVCHAAE